MEDASLFYITGATGTAVRFFPAATTSTFFSGAGGAAFPLDAGGGAFLVYYYCSSLVVSSASSYAFFLVSTFSFLLLFLGYSGAFLGGSTGSTGGVAFLLLPFLGGKTLLSSFLAALTFFLGLVSSLTGIFVSCEGGCLMSSSAFDAISTSTTCLIYGIRAVEMLKSSFLLVYRHILKS